MIVRSIALLAGFAALAGCGAANPCTTCLAVEGRYDGRLDAVTLSAGCEPGASAPGTLSMTVDRTDSALSVTLAGHILKGTLYQGDASAAAFDARATQQRAIADATYELAEFLTGVMTGQAIDATWRARLTRLSGGTAPCESSGRVTARRLE